MRKAPGKGTTGRWRWRAILLAGDVAVFLVFAALGTASHDEGVTPWTLLRASAPFGIAWVALAPFLGAYNPEAALAPRSVCWRIPLLWVPCDLAALLLRSWWLDRPLVPSFVVVTLLVAGLMLTAWRAGFAIVAGRRLRSAPDQGA